MAKKTTTPLFTALNSAYPTVNSPTVNSPCSDAYANQYAIRMSKCWIDAGGTLSGYSDHKCSHGHARGAQALADWFWRQAMGRPRIFISAATAKTELGSSQGIIYFKDCWGDGGTGDHIDLWYKGRTKGFDDPNNASREVWFWSISG